MDLTAGIPRPDLEEQLERAVEEGHSMAILSIAADPTVDPVALLNAAGDDRVFFWQEPSAGRAFLGIGSAWEATGGTDNRFTTIAEELEALDAGSLRLGLPRSPFVGAGFAFSPESQWNALPSALARLPRLAYVRDYEGTFWQVAEPITDPHQTAEKLVAGLDRATKLAGVPSPDPLPVGRHPEALDDPVYRKLVASAIHSIERGEFEKVVLARSVETPATPDLGRLLARLGTQHPEAASFAIGDGRSVFCGATPELLVRWSQGRARSVALAGTVARGETPAEDALFGETLMADPKEHAEHQFVIDHVVERLAEMGLKPKTEATDLMKLSAVQHLRTTIEAEGDLNGGVIPLVAALHPTPAVGGTPDSGALDFITRHEGLDRGWYAGPLGVMNLDGEGEFWVALRCALLDRDHSTLFAGAGIVAESEPDRELAETTLKLQNLGALIGLA
jgi:isochorismate synthase